MGTSGSGKGVKKHGVEASEQDQNKRAGFWSLARSQTAK